MLEKTEFHSGVGSMKNRRLQNMVLVLFALVSVLCATGHARADTYADCMNGRLGQRIASCSAVIDDPATTAFDLEHALEIRGADLAIAKRYSEAIQDLDRALKLDPQSATALNGRAWSLFRWKKTADGMDDVNASLRINGAYAAAWDTRAHLFQVLGQFAKAFNEYEAAIGFGGPSFVRIYQCGLKERGLYKGPADGIYSSTVRAALRSCAFSASCDPLPENEYEEECGNVSS
jgi:tetratricopeptide (TPR) repeat protein